ncbi:MAG: hypothetical protein AAF770_02455 [Bacteroidota bacterium]
MGCARHIWNPKTKEEKEQRLYLSTEKRKEYPTTIKFTAISKTKKKRHGSLIIQALFYAIA